MNDSAVISPSFHHTPLSLHSLLSMSPAHPLPSSLQLSIFSLLSFNLLSPSFFLSAYLLSCTCHLYRHFFNPTFTLWSPLSSLRLPTPVLSCPFCASLLIILVPPRQCVLITQCHLHTWAGRDKRKMQKNIKKTRWVGECTKCQWQKHCLLPFAFLSFKEILIFFQLSKSHKKTVKGRRTFLIICSYSPCWIWV